MMTRFFKLSYHFNGDEVGVNDNFESTFNLNRNYTPEQMIIFLKAFLYKVPFINDKEIIDQIIPYQIDGLDENYEEDDTDLEDEIEEELNRDNIKDELDELNAIDLSNVDDNLDKFKEQIQNNDEFLKAVFVNFIHHMND